jgi:uncharacterized SAM-binding protein YcdF (DUF218 family)
MSSPRFRQVRRLVPRAAAGLLILASLALLVFLPFAGRYLVINDPLTKSDAIVVLAGARVERWLEAVDLYKEGWAPRIVLSPGRPETAEVLLREMGVRFPAETDLTRDALVQLGVPEGAISVLPGPVDNTAHEAAALHSTISGHAPCRMIVVTSKYHTRRTRFAFAREFNGTPIEIIVRGTRYDQPRPERWWTTRSDFRFVTSELQKLLAYRFGLGE